MLDPDSLPAAELLGAALAVDAEADGAEVLVELLGVLLAFAGLLLLLADFPALESTFNCSCTRFTPVADLARSLAFFLSSFEATVPVRVATPLVTDT
jgi:hypothetical protein